MKVTTEQKQVTYKVTPTDYWWVSQKKKNFFNLSIYLFFLFCFLVSHPCVEDCLSIVHSEGAALLGMKPQPISKLSTNGVAPGSLRMCGAWQVRGQPPFKQHPMSQEEGLSTLDPNPDVWLGATHRYPRDAGLNRKVYRRGENGMIYSKYCKKKCQPIILYPA